MACGCIGSGRTKGKTSLNAAATPPRVVRYEVTRPDGTSEQYSSLVDALRERNRTKGSYRQIR